MADNLAAELSELLRQRSLRVVLAESCTAGAVAATLAALHGSSDLLCGSMVVYRDQSKLDWLDVDRSNLTRLGAVSEVVAAQMARGVLVKTPEADLAASITGHLGPGAPQGLDGVVMIGTAWRDERGIQLREVVLKQLQARDRLERRREATELVLGQLVACLKGTGHVKGNQDSWTNCDKKISLDS